MTAPFIGIYSFPKSGNTWMRQIIAELFFDGVAESVPDIHRQNIHDAELATLPNGKEMRFYKCHGDRLTTRSPLRPIRHAGVIYLKRHPLDVFLSYLNFMRKDVNRAPKHGPLEQFGSVEELVENGRISDWLDRYIKDGTIDQSIPVAGTWFSNVANWSAAVRPGGKAMPLITIRYEDMVADPTLALEPVRELLGVSDAAMNEALQRAGKKTQKDGYFFWKQQPGLYKQMLSPSLIERFAAHRGKECARLGYEIEVPANA